MIFSLFMAKGTIVCPHCGAEQTLEIPEGVCIPFHACEKCGRQMKADGQCCIFCAYGDTPCPVGHKKRKP